MKDTKENISFNAKAEKEKNSLTAENAKDAKEPVNNKIEPQQPEDNSTVNKRGVIRTRLPGKVA
jgi:hypothetical protein